MRADFSSQDLEESFRVQPFIRKSLEQPQFAESDPHRGNPDTKGFCQTSHADFRVAAAIQAFGHGD